MERKHNKDLSVIAKKNMTKEEKQAVSTASLQAKEAIITQVTR